MIDALCIFCHQNDNSIPVIQENGYQGKKCIACNLIYISPRPTAEHITNLYGHDQAHIPASSHIAQEYPKKLHALHALTIIKKYIQKGDLLELGSGAGYFLTQAQLQGFTPHGIELNPVQATFIRERLKIPCLESPLALDSFDNKKFDIIYHSDVLSHLYDPIQSMLIMKEKLNPGGYLIFETGNIADINHKYYNTFNAMQYPDHLFFFGRTSLEKLLTITGLTLEEYYSYSILPQLRVMKAVKTIKNILLSSKKNSPPPSLTHSATRSDTPYRLKNIARTGYHTFMHSLRYTLGAYVSQKKEKPQTVIVVAKNN